MENANLPDTLETITEPYRSGCKVLCLWRNQRHEAAEILASRKRPGTDNYEYYVHYVSFNKRLDEWVLPDKFDMAALLESERKRRRRSLAKEATRRAKATTETKSKRPSSSQDPVKSGRKRNAVGSLKTTKDDPTSRKNVQTIVLGSHAIDTWYHSPFPDPYGNYSTLYICEFCFKFVRMSDTLQRHCQRCVLRHPPGNEIYRDGEISVFEIDGDKNRAYCQNLSYVSKLFLDHKNASCEIGEFWFYILCEMTDRGAQVVGYFSKEKESEQSYNLACILTLPPFQRKGYGRFLIAFSYELSKIENRVGSPEKPLSDLGLLGYRKYWSEVLIALLQTHDEPLSICDISDKTMMTTHDIADTLKALDVLRYTGGAYHFDMSNLRNVKLTRKGLTCKPSQIRWVAHSVGSGTREMRKEAEEKTDRRRR